MVNSITFTPTQDKGPTESAVTTQDYAAVGPLPANPLYQKSQNSCSLFCPINPAREKVTDKKVITTEHVKGQVTVMVIISAQSAWVQTP